MTAQEQLKALLDSGATIRSIAKLLGVAPSTVFKWLHEKANPRPSKVAEIRGLYLSNLNQEPPILKAANALKGVKWDYCLCQQAGTAFFSNESYKIAFDDIRQEEDVMHLLRNGAVVATKKI